MAFLQGCSEKSPNRKRTAVLVDLLLSSISWLRSIIRRSGFRGLATCHSRTGRSNHLLALPNADTVPQHDLHSDYSALHRILCCSTLLHSHGEARTDDEPHMAGMESYRNKHIDRRVGIWVSLVTKQSNSINWSENLFQDSPHTVSSIV